MAYERKDRFYKKAKAEGFVSRAAYKLIELDNQFKLLRPGMRLVDCGAAPGGWLQVACKKLGPSSRLVGIDLLPLHGTFNFPSLTFILGDLTLPATQEKILAALGAPADVVLSDIAPNITGVKFKDAAASLELDTEVLKLAYRCLKPGGKLVVKIFPGQEFADFKKELKTAFNQVTEFIPEATRKTSIEVYLVATGFRPASAD